MDYALRLATPDDEPFLEHIFKDVNRADFLPMGLPGDRLEELLTLQAKAQYNGYALQFPTGENFIVMVGPYPIGRIYVAALETELLIVDMALLTAFRGQGVGTKLILEVQRRAQAAGLPVTLRVEPYKPAARLYLRLGFEVTGADPINLLMRWGQADNAAGTAPVPGQEDEAPVEPGHSSAFFRTLLGKTLPTVGPDGSAIELTLRELNVQQRRDPQAIPGDSFSLRFDVPAGVPMWQGMFDVTVAPGISLSIFLSPVRFGDGGVGYQAVYNRHRMREPRAL